MPTIDINSAHIFFYDTGETNLPILLCLHSLAFDHRMFEAQLEDFSGKYRLICPDFRGQGRSRAPGRGPISMETCADDILALIDVLGLPKLNIFAQSMGGDVALRLAITHPDRIEKLVLAGASACAEDPANLRTFRLSQKIVKRFGSRPVLKPTLEIMFGQTFRNDPAQKTLFTLWRKRLARGPRRLHHAIAGVIDRKSVEADLHKITSATLIFAGDEDTARPVDWSRKMAAGLPNAKLIVLPKVGHSPAIEAPKIINQQIAAFLDANERGKS